MVFGTIIALIPFILAGIALILAILQLLEIGIPINTAYLFSSQIVRDAMNKKPYFRQSAITLFLICGALLSMGLDMMYASGIFFLLECACMIAVIVYLVVSNKRLK